MRDVRNAADFLGQTYCNGYDQHHLRDLRILGSKIACDGAVQSGQSKWADCVLNGCDGVWNADGSTIANLLGLSLLVRRAHNLFDVDPRPGFENVEAALLHYDLNSKRVLPHIGSPPRGPQAFQVGGPLGDSSARTARRAAGIKGFGSPDQKVSVGTTGMVYIVRADGKPLPFEHTEALCSYIKDKIEPQLRAATEGLPTEGLPTGAIGPQRGDILNSITKGSFLEYYDALKETKIAQGQLSWRDFPNPYDITPSSMHARIEATLRKQQCEDFEQQSEKIIRQERDVLRGNIRMDELQEALGLNVPF